MSDHTESSRQVKKPSRLGRGLSSLMSTPVHVSPPLDQGQAIPGGGQDMGGTSASETDQASSGFAWVAVDAIRPNRHQPRQFFDAKALQGLADSIRSEGLMQPVVLKSLDVNGQYELVAGERRWRAAKLAGLEHIPALLRDLNDQKLAEWALVENLQREDLNPIERAEAFERLGTAFGLSHDDIACRVGLERSTVTNLLRLLKLAGPVREMVSRGTLSMGQSRALAGIEDFQDQASLAERCIKEDWSVRQVESAVRAYLAGKATPPSTSPKIIQSAHLVDLERQIAEQLKTKVKLKAGRKKGAGALTINFYSIEQFDSLLASLGVIPQ